MTMTTTEKPAGNGAIPAVQAPQGKAAQLIVQDGGSFANLLDTAKFEHMWRVAQVFSISGMVPKFYDKKPEACFVALQMAVRLDVDPMMFMQNTYMSPDGKPALYGQLAIALVNARGPFRGPIQFELSGAGDTRRCTAWQISKSTGERCEVTVDVAMAKAEGWYGRNPKWRTITDMMLRYRAGAWLGRVYAPECLMGMQTAEEVEDVHGTLEPQGDGAYAPRPTRAQVAQAAEPAEDDAAATAEAEAMHRAMDREAMGKPPAEEPEEPEATAIEEIRPPADPKTGRTNWNAWSLACIDAVKRLPTAAAVAQWREANRARIDTAPPSFADKVRQAVDEALDDPGRPPRPMAGE